MVNIRDVAKLAEVSPGTVSRILSKDPGLSVNEKTREKVYRVCQELNYVPRKYKREGHSNSVGIISATSRERENDDLYYRKIREKLVQSSKAKKFCIDFMIFLPNLEDNWQQIKSVNCIIIIGHIDHKIHEKIFLINSNIIIVDDYYCSKKYSSISVDFYSEMTMILDYVYEMGHTNIAFIGGKNQRLTLDSDYLDDGLGDREKAYIDWMEHKKLTKYRQLYIGENWFAQTGYDLTTKLLNDKKVLPSVIIAGSDILALGILKKLTVSGIEVPRDLSICSFDDLEMASFLSPSLTSLRVDIDQMVYWITKLCEKMMENKLSAPVKIILSGKLVKRESLKEFF